MQKYTIYKAIIIHIADDPFNTDENKCIRYFKNGGLVVSSDGLIIDCDDWKEIENKYQDHSEYQLIDASDKLIIPGLIDTHLHFPQLYMIGSYGEQLMEWLSRYTFPTENKYADNAFAEKSAQRFWKSLLKNGTTTSVVYSTIHKSATDILFQYAEKIGVRSIIGKVMMDNNAPDFLTENTEQSVNESIELYNKWNNKSDLLNYVFTPRFAPTSTHKMFELLKDVSKTYPDAYWQTHLSENKSEIEFVHSLFPERKSYTDVYYHYGILGPKTLMGHCIHLSDDEIKLMKDTDTVIAHCPTSNFFLGSGLFPMKKLQQHGIRIGIASDIGGGNYISMLKVMDEAYKMQQLLNNPISPIKLLYMSTLASAEALSLEKRIGNFEKGKEADFIIIDLSAIDEISYRLENMGFSPIEILSSIIFMGDDRIVKDVYTKGKKVY